MKLTLRIAIALAVLTTATAAYAEIPDVSKWSCPNNVVENVPDYGVVVTMCDDSAGSLYVKVSGELIHIHEHRMDAGAAVYYNALKTNEGNWVEVVNKRDLVWGSELTETGDVVVNIIDDNGVVVAKRIVPLLKK